MRSIVYVDGFNFYYGAVRGTAHKWLNLWELSRILLPRDDIRALKYYTAKVSARPGDPDAPTRQETYFRALRSVPGIEIHLGHFLSNKKWLPRADGTGSVQVLNTEEKGSDVNLATHLVADAFLGRFERALVMTNDSDLAEPIRLVTHQLGLPVWVLAPVLTPGRKASNVLQSVATQFRSLRTGALRRAQFPQTLKDARGDFHKPPTW